QSWDTDAGQELAAGSSRTYAVLIGLAVALGIIPAGLFVLQSRAEHQYAVQQHHVEQAVPLPVPNCQELGCWRAPTVLLTKRNPTRSSGFDRRHLCDFHARASAWEVNQSGTTCEIFDIKSGRPRSDLQP